MPTRSKMVIPSGQRVRKPARTRARDLPARAHLRFHRHGLTAMAAPPAMHASSLAAIHPRRTGAGSHQKRARPGHRPASRRAARQPYRGPARHSRDRPHLRQRPNFCHHDPPCSRAKAERQHAVIECVQEMRIADPTALLDQLAMHDRDLAGQAAETEYSNFRPDAGGLAQRDHVAGGRCHVVNRYRHRIVLSSRVVDLPAPRAICALPGIAHPAERCSLIRESPSAAWRSPHWRPASNAHSGPSRTLPRRDRGRGRSPAQARGSIGGWH